MRLANECKADRAAPAFDGIKDRADVLSVASDALVSSYGTRINTLALGARLPAMFGVSNGAPSPRLDGVGFLVQFDGDDT
jgi:hypothetical protein